MIIKTSGGGRTSITINTENDVASVNVNSIGGYIACDQFVSGNPDYEIELNKVNNSEDKALLKKFSSMTEEEFSNQILELPTVEWVHKKVKPEECICVHEGHKFIDPVENKEVIVTVERTEDGKIKEISIKPAENK